MILLEREQGLTFVHCGVMRWNAHVARAMAHCMDVLTDLHAPLYTFAEAPHAGDREKWRKFVCHFGFKFFATITHDGWRHSVYVRNKKWTG